MNYEFDCEIISPLFMGGFDHEPEIRAASIKGALRFWFRALYGAILYSKNSDDNTVVKEMLIKEKLIFGSTESRSSFSMTVVVDEKTVSKKLFDLLVYGGYGLQGIPNIRKKARNGYTKVSFKLMLSFFLPNHEFEEVVVDSLSLLNYFGALGARNSRGFGSISIIPAGDSSMISIKQSVNESITDSVKKYFSELYARYHIGDAVKRPAFPTISPNYFEYNVYGRKGIGDIKTKLKTFSRALREFRDTTEKTSDGKNFHSVDYDAVKKNITDTADGNVFGLPHNFRFSDGPEANIVGKRLKGEDIKRRNSPLKFSFFKSGADVYPVIVLFKSDFIPDGCSLTVESKDKKITNHALDLPGYEFASDFMKEFERKP